MKLERAIEILTSAAIPYGNPDIIEATKLGIEDLKAYRQARQEGQLSPDELLPGETKD